MNTHIFVDPDDPNGNWDNNGIQFPRLIAEMEAAGIFEVLAKDSYVFSTPTGQLLESMDLEWDDLMEIVDRAQSEWDRVKERITP